MIQRAPFMLGSSYCIVYEYSKHSNRLKSVVYEKQRRGRTEQRRKVTHDEKGGSGATTEMPPNKDILYDGYELN